MQAGYNWAQEALPWPFLRRGYEKARHSLGNFLDTYIAGRGDMDEENT